MRAILMGLGGAALLLAPALAAAQETEPGQMGDGSGQAAGGPGESNGIGSHIKAAAPHGTKPILREKFDDSIGKLFRSADTNRDGMITLAEFNAIIDQRKNEVIADRFKQIDANNDKSLSYDEFYRWQQSLGSAVLDDATASPDLMGLVSEEIRYYGGRSDYEFNMSLLVAPLTATALVEANTNYDGGVTLDELVAWENKTFDAADTTGDGWVTPNELQIYLGRKRPGG